MINIQTEESGAAHASKSWIVLRPVVWCWCGYRIVDMALSLPHYGPCVLDVVAHTVISVISAFIWLVSIIHPLLSCIR